jgi:catechol O-methyltransferase
MSDEDPFDCFGDDDHDDDDSKNANAVSGENAPSPLRRDSSNGILAFHAGTEQALLNHVQQEMLMSPHVSAPSEKAAAVLRSIDEFSLQRHWMMHVGQEKGTIVEEFLKECLQANAASKPVVPASLSLVEIGTYCGYSSILLAKTLKSLNCDFNICSVEVVEQNAQVARKMVELAGLADCINILLLDPGNDSLEELLRRNMKSDSVDFLFLDHDKSLYLSDLQKLEKSSFIKKGCFVAADNVVFARIDDYRHYISELEKEGTVRTRLAMSWLEYCEPDHDGDETKKKMMEDGIGKSTLLSVLILQPSGTRSHAARPMGHILFCSVICLSQRPLSIYRYCM